MPKNGHFLVISSILRGSYSMKRCKKILYNETETLARVYMLRFYIQPDTRLGGSSQKKRSMTTLQFLLKCFFKGLLEGGKIEGKKSPPPPPPSPTLASSIWPSVSPKNNFLFNLDSGDLLKKKCLWGSHLKTLHAPKMSPNYDFSLFSFVS